MLPPLATKGDTFTPEGLSMLRQGGEGRGSGPLADRLVPLQKKEDSHGD
jgi:hypothetical protein